MIEIRKTRVYSLEGNLPDELKGKQLMLAVDFTANADAAAQAGFGSSPSEGDTVLPKVIGSATKLNSWGREIIRRDQPMETHFRTQAWTHEEWRGRGETETVTSFVDVPYHKYPRDHEPATGIELTIAEKDGQKLITTLLPITYDSANIEQLKAAINVFLEIFGATNVYDKSLEPIITRAQFRRLNWRILPPGKKLKPGELEKALDEVLSKSPRTRPVQVARQNKIASFGFDEGYVGTAGFRGYIVYLFPKKGLAVLESLNYGNATYILKQSNWKELSKLTKQQLTSANLVEHRLIHTKNWFSEIEKLLEEPK